MGKVLDEIYIFILIIICNDFLGIPDLVYDPTFKPDVEPGKNYMP